MSSVSRFSSILRDVTNEQKEIDDLQMAQKLEAQDVAEHKETMKILEKCDSSVAEKLQKELEDEVKALDLAREIEDEVEAKILVQREEEEYKSMEFVQKITDFEDAKRISKNLQAEMAGEEAAYRAHNEELEAHAEQKRAVAADQEAAYKAHHEEAEEFAQRRAQDAKMLNDDEAVALAAQATYHRRAAREDADWEAARRAQGALAAAAEREAARRERADRALAEKCQRQLEREASQEQQLQARADGQAAAAAQRALDRERARELAWQRLMGEVAAEEVALREAAAAAQAKESGGGGGEGGEEEDEKGAGGGYGARVDRAFQDHVRKYWRAPRHEFVEVPGGAVQLAVHLPGLRYAELRHADGARKKGLKLFARRAPFKSPTTGITHTAEVSLTINLETGKMDLSKINHEYEPKWDIVYVYIEDSKLSALNRTARAELVRGLRARAEGALASLPRRLLLRRASSSASSSSRRPSRSSSMIAEEKK